MKDFKVEVGQALIKEVRMGAPYNVLAEANGLKEGTLRAWLEKGIDDADADLDTPLATFAMAFRKAELSLIKISMRSIRKANKFVEWRNHAWFLENVYPRNYGSKTLEMQYLHDEVQAIKAMVNVEVTSKIMNKPVVKVVDDVVD